MIVQIDNTRGAGNFFDNMMNDVMTVTEYNVDENVIEDIEETMKDTDLNISFKDDFIKYGEELYSALKYDYVNNDNIASYISKINESGDYNKLYREINKEFKITENQYKQCLKFFHKHTKCMKNLDGSLRYGAIGGGLSTEYVYGNLDGKIRALVHCHTCDSYDELTNDEVEYEYESWEKYDEDYSSHMLDDVELVRLKEIWDEYGHVDKIKITATGLGIIVICEVDGFMYDITNIDNW